MANLIKIENDISLFLFGGGGGCNHSLCLYFLDVVLFEFLKKGNDEPGLSDFEDTFTYPVLFPIPVSPYTLRRILGCPGTLCYCKTYKVCTVQKFT